MTASFWFFLGLIGLTLGLHLAARLFYGPAVAWIFGQVPWLPSEWREPLEEGERVELTAADGSRLRGTYLPTTAAQRQGRIACCHEFNGDRWNMLPYAESLRRRGFDVFLFDFRNHGASDRIAGYEPTPWVTSYEVADVRTAIEYLASREDGPEPRIGLFGVGKGATAALCAADDPRVQAVVLDGVCPVERLQVHALRAILAGSLPGLGWLAGTPEIVFEPLARWIRMILGWRRRCRFVSVEQAARRAHAPVLMIHGQADPHVSVELICQLRDAMPAPAKLWVVPGARHHGAIRVATDEYQERVGRFFSEHLGAAPSYDPAHPPVPARHLDNVPTALQEKIPAVQGG